MEEFVVLDACVWTARWHLEIASWTRPTKEAYLLLGTFTRYTELGVICGSFSSVEMILLLIMKILSHFENGPDVITYW